MATNISELAFGVPENCLLPARRLFDPNSGIPRDTRPIRYKRQDFHNLIRSSRDLCNPSDLQHIPNLPYGPNIALENQAVSCSIMLENIGQIHFSITPESAVIRIENDETAANNPSPSSQLLENLGSMKINFANLARQVAPTVNKWLDEQGDLLPKADELTPYALLTRDWGGFQNWINSRFEKNVSQNIINWFATATDDQKRFAQNILVAASESRERTLDFMQSPFSSDAALKWGAAYFPGSVCEMLAEQNALTVRAQLEKGNLRDPLIRLLRGGSLETSRTSFSQGYRMASDLSFSLPKTLQSIVTVSDQGDTYFDLSKVGLDKIGLVDGTVKNALEQLRRFTGLYYEPQTELHFGSSHLEHPSPRYPFLKPCSRFLLGEKANLKRFPDSVQAQAKIWQEQGFAMATLVGPTGSGKTTLAREITKNLIPFDIGAPSDVLVYEFTFPQESEVSTATTYGQDSLRQLAIQTYQNLAIALEQFQTIAARRPNRATIFFCDNFHLLPFAVDPPTAQKLLNTADKLHSLSAGKDIKPNVGIFFMGERLPDGMDFSLIQPHRFNQLVIEPKMDEFLGIGRQAVEGFFSQQFQDSCNSMVSQINGETEEARQQNIQSFKERQQKLPSFIAGVFQDHLLTHSGFMKLASQPEQIAYFTNTYWQEIAQQIYSFMEAEMTDYLVHGTSDYFEADATGLRLTNQAENLFQTELSRIIDATINRTGGVAVAKSGELVELEKPPSQQLEASPQLDLSNLNHQTEDLARQANLLNQQIVTLTAQREEILHSAEIVTQLTQQVEKYGPEGVEYLVQENNLLSSLSEPGFAEKLIANDGSIVTDDFRHGLIAQKERFLSLVGKLLPEDMKSGIGQIRNQLTVLEALFDNDVTWQDETDRASLTPVALAQLQQILQTVSNKTVIEKIQEVRDAYQRYQGMTIPPTR